MRIRRKASLVLAGGLVAAIAAVPSTANAAAQTLSITVGGDSEVNNVSFEGMRFLAPGNLTVHKGDTLTFNFEGFHTATLIPAGVGADDWRADHATGVTGDYSLIQPDGDDGATQFRLNPQAVFPGDPACGSATTPCTYDGKSVVNSGLSVLTGQPFSVTVNANPGDTFWVLCLVHNMMQTRVQVVADNVATTTQAAIDSYASSQTAQDKDEAAAVINNLQQPTRHTTAAGTKVWDAYAGFDGDGWGLNGMFPKKLKVAKGDTVRWHFAQLVGDLHTVTFPKSEAVALSNAFGEPVCEADPADTPADAPPPAFCSSGPQNLELHIPGALLLPAGSHNYGGTGVRSSGVGGRGISSAPYDLKFTHKSPKGSPFKYACAIHGGMMHGKVVVS